MCNVYVKFGDSVKFFKIGSEFKNALSAKVLKDLGIKLVHSSPVTLMVIVSLKDFIITS